MIRVGIWLALFCITSIIFMVSLDNAVGGTRTKIMMPLAIVGSGAMMGRSIQKVIDDSKEASDEVEL